MAKNYKTEQENFWAGKFGDDYADRNKGLQWIASNCAMFSKILSHTSGVRSVVEFGANIGLNLRAIKQLIPQVSMDAVEINAQAIKELDNWGGCKTHHTTILEFKSKKKWDMTLIKGVMIHIDPTQLEKVYDLLYESSNRYICIAEYYNPNPVSIPYRGHKDRLFKRDFAGEILDRFPSVKLLDYGFCYHRDHNFPQDDITWFLLEKNS